MGELAAQPRWSQADLWDLFDLSPVSDSDIAKYLDITLAKCVSWFRASGGSIFLADGGERFGLQAKVGAQSKLPEDAAVISGVGIAGIVAASGVARLIDDPTFYADMSEVETKQSISSSMVIPLVDVRRRVIGVLNISRKTGEHPFEERDLDQAVALAAHVTLAVTNAQMVTRLKSTVKETKLANEKLTAVLDSVGGAVIVVDGDGEIVNKNSTAEEDILAPSAGRLGESISHVIWDTLTLHETVKKPFYDSDFDRTWMVEARPLNSGGAVITCQEITDHERQQRELGRVRRLAEIGQMTAAIAHEIRNPLTGIRSAAQMISQHPETMPDFIGAIEEEALKLNDLCDEFLEFARPMQLNLQPVVLSDVIGDVLKVLKPFAEEKGIEIKFEFSSVGEQVQLDIRRVGQIVHNLVRNAFDASQPGQSITVTAEGGTFKVTDQGIGMSEEQVAKLFSAFFTTKSAGTGLGLSVCRKIVDAHGGEIRVQSEVGKGTTFEVCLDRNQK